MANTFLTPSIIAKEALMVLRNNAVMSKLVYRDYSDEFVGAVGDTITVRKPASFTAKEFTSNIDIQSATETGVTVTMDKHLDVSFSVTAKDLTLNIKSFSEQLLVPAMQAFNDKVDKIILTDMIANVDEGMTITHAAGTPIAPADVVDLRKLLVANAVPNSQRYFVTGSEIEADLLKSDLFVSAEKVGDSGTALREASLGRKYGLDFFTDQNLGMQTASPNYHPALAFHRNAYALVTRPLARPVGTNMTAYESYDGFGLRVTMGYDLKTKTDTVSIDMLCGVKMLDKRMLALLKSQISA